MSTIAQTNALRSASVEVCFQPNRRGVGKSLAGLREGAVVKQTAPIRVISFVLLAACGALCQKPPSADWLQGLQFDGSNPPEVQRQEMRAAGSLPDAPSTVQPPTHVERFFTFVNAAGSPSIPGALGVGVMRETKLGHFTTGPQRNLPALYQVAFIQKGPALFLVSTCIRPCSSRTHVITLRPATALWAGPPTQLRAFLSRVTTPGRGG